MHGVVGNSQRSALSDSAKMAKLREALALAREQLVRAVSDRGADTVLSPLRNRVAVLLEEIERLHGRNRFRR
jgi:hypothetical protein